MKRILMLFLVAMTFVSCGGSMFGKGETAELNLTNIGFVDAERSASDVYEITLDFVGTAPTCDNFEKTKTTTDPDSISYSITGLRVGDKVQLKLTIKRNGSLIAEGVSEEKTLGIGSNHLSISMKKVRDWVYTFDYVGETGPYISIFDKNYGTFKTYNGESVKAQFSDVPGDFCSDDEGNLYVVEFVEEEEDWVRVLYRYEPEDDGFQKYTICSGLVGDFFTMYYDSSKDALYVMSGDNIKRTVYKFENPSQITNLDASTIESKKVSEFSLDILNTGSNDFNFDCMAVAAYNGTIYYAGTTPGSGAMLMVEGDPENKKYFVVTDVYEEDLNEDSVLIPVTGLEVEKGIYSGYGNKEYMMITDMAVNETGIYLLMRYNRNGLSVKADNTEPQNSRGAVVKLDLGLTKGEAIGWTKTKQVYSKYDTKYLTFYNPKSIKDGFYGPQKILAIKPKELVFADDGYTLYVTDDGKWLRAKEKNNIVSVNLETLSYTSMEAFVELSDSIGGMSSDSNFTETWEED